jgi:hypothetical protein
MNTYQKLAEKRRSGTAETGQTCPVTAQGKAGRGRGGLLSAARRKGGRGRGGLLSAARRKGAAETGAACSARPGGGARPSRRRADIGPAGIEEAGPAGICCAGPAEAAGMPAAQPAWGSAGPAGIGQEEPIPAQNGDAPASKA